VAESIRLDVPAPVWWMLAEQAEERGQTVVEYLASLGSAHVIRATTGSPRPIGQTTQRVAELHALGDTDRAIAKRLGVDVHAVHYHRKKLGLRPNPGRAA
jgi:hypothetical protein